MRKFKCFACHKFGNYVGKCMHGKKGENEMHSEVAALENYQLDEFCKKFEHTDFLLISHTYLGIISDSAWLIDNAAKCNMTRA
jgi:hypothetical protein